MNEKYDKKYQTFKDCGALISAFLEKKKEKIENGSYFIKIKELYNVLELYEHFDQVFDYIKSRLKSIKQIYESSDQFQNTLQYLNKILLENDQKYENMIKEYESTISCFNELSGVLNEMTEIDNIIKEKLIK